jgi:hypothetical protein
MHCPGLLPLSGQVGGPGPWLAPQLKSYCPPRVCPSLKVHSVVHSVLLGVCPYGCWGGGRSTSTSRVDQGTEPVERTEFLQESFFRGVSLMW